MKKLIVLFSLMIAVSSCLNAQISHEATYDSSFTDLQMITLEVDGDKYMKIQRGDSAHRFIRLYNLDHSIWKTIDCNSFPMFTHYAFGGLNGARFHYILLYVTQHLFDDDDGIEFMFNINSSGCYQHYTGIYNEDGSLIFAQDSAGPYINLNVPQTQRPIYNTEEGTKMILTFRCSGESRVYSLPGTLTTSMLAPEEWGYKSMQAFPNPSSFQTTIAYELPIGVYSGEIMISDMKGNEIRRYNIDDTFNSLIIDNQDFSSGTYLYSLIANGEILGTDKFVVVK